MNNLSAPVALWLGQDGLLGRAILEVVSSVGFEVRSAPDYWRGLRAVRREVIDLVILEPNFSEREVGDLLADAGIQQSRPYVMVSESGHPTSVFVGGAERVLRLKAPYQAAQVMAAASIAMYDLERFNVAP